MVARTTFAVATVSLYCCEGTPTPAPPTTPCVARPDRPAVPATALDLNGVEYPAACYELKEENHFYVIGDWGGMCGYGVQSRCQPGQWSDRNGVHDSSAPRPMYNRHGQFVPGIDDEAQQRVAARMDDLASQSPPNFVISVGGNFNPGGIAETCNADGSTYDFSHVPHQFESTFENIYNSTYMTDAEWMGVLGNHDYGGMCISKGWPQQIYYTWNQVHKRWVLPAQYYNRKIRFSKDGSADWDEEDVTIDMFFLDSNHANTGTNDPNHDICSTKGNSDNTHFCSGFLGPNNDSSCPGTDNHQGGPSLWSSERVCSDFFQYGWLRQLEWLEDLLDKSTADWQMIVTHYPPAYVALQQLTPLLEKYGVDLIMSGHTHMQQVHYQDSFINYDIGDTAWIVSGGGGGITSEGPPAQDYTLPEGDRATGYDDQYGFMDMVVTKDQLSIRPYSHGRAPDGSLIMRKGAEVHRRPRADLKDSRPVKARAQLEETVV